MPPLADRPELYAVPTVAEGRDVVVMAGAFAVVVFPGKETITGTEFESLPVCLLCTVRATTPGVAMLLL